MMRDGSRLRIFFESENEANSDIRTLIFFEEPSVRSHSIPIAMPNIAATKLSASRKLTATVILPWQFPTTFY